MSHVHVEVAKNTNNVVEKINNIEDGDTSAYYIWRTLRSNWTDESSTKGNGGFSLTSLVWSVKLKILNTRWMSQVFGMMFKQHKLLLKS